MGRKELCPIGKMLFNCNFIILFHPPSPLSIKIVQFSRLFMQVVAVIKMEKKVFSSIPLSMACVKVGKKYFHKPADWLWSVAKCRILYPLFSVVIVIAHDHRHNFPLALFSTIFPFLLLLRQAETMRKNS